ncbi:MAG: HD domain-containing protein [Bacillota bacterium]|nr:MAG: HD domain-containing protein [Bacillota bacterium]
MIEDIKKVVEEKLREHPKRYQHVLGVYETAIKLALIHHADEHKAAIAALFHDYAKYDSIEDQIQHLELKVIKHYADAPVMYHAFAAAYALETMFQIRDQEILNAIRYHVFGRKDMGLIEKIIFVADYCEPSRNFSDVTYIYDLATKDMDQAVLYCMKLTLDDVIKKDKTPHEDQVAAYNYYLEVNSGKIK